MVHLLRSWGIVGVGEYGVKWGTEERGSEDYGQVGYGHVVVFGEL